MAATTRFHTPSWILCSCVEHPSCGHRQSSATPLGRTAFSLAASRSAAAPLPPTAASSTMGFGWLRRRSSWRAKQGWRGRRSRASAAGWRGRVLSGLEGSPYARRWACRAEGGRMGRSEARVECLYHAARTARAQSWCSEWPHGGEIAYQGR